MPKNKEDYLYKQIAEYMNLQYPDVYYHFDLSGVNNPSMYSRSLYHLLNGNGWPDMFIASGHSHSHGLFLELKIDGSSPFKKNGELKSSEHLENQQRALERLKSAGYSAYFATGFDEAKRLIDLYLRVRQRQ